MVRCHVGTKSKTRPWIVAIGLLVFGGVLISAAILPGSNPLYSAQKTYPDHTTSGVDSVYEQPKALADFENAKTSFYACAKYQAKSGSFPIYDREHLAVSLLKMRLACEDVYYPAYHACLNTGMGDSVCQGKLAEAEDLAILHAQ
jgi:hypothetical protein